MWTCRLLHQSLSSAKLAAVSLEKIKLQALITSLTSSGQFVCLSDVIPYEDTSVFDCSTYFKHFSSIPAEVPSTTSFGQTLIVADVIPTTMKLLDG